MAKSSRNQEKETDRPRYAILEEALSGSDADKWMVAPGEEVSALSEHRTFELCELPKGKKAISGKWILKIKRGPSNEALRQKAKYVARGFNQVEGVDYFETWSQ